MVLFIEVELTTRLSIPYPDLSIVLPYNSRQAAQQKTTQVLIDQEAGHDYRRDRAIGLASLETRR